MTDSELSQGEADALLEMAKRRVEAGAWEFPAAGQRLAIPLESVNRREQFLLDLYRGRINLAKGTHQNRARRVVVLARLDYGGPPHRNPDGAESGPTHLHLYREGYGDRWAFEPPRGAFSDLNDRWRTLEDFLRFCNVIEPVVEQRELIWHE